MIEISKRETAKFVAAVPRPSGLQKPSKLKRLKRQAGDDSLRENGRFDASSRNKSNVATGSRSDVHTEVIVRDGSTNGTSGKNVALSEANTSDLSMFLGVADVGSAGTLPEQDEGPLLASTSLKDISESEASGLIDQLMSPRKVTGNCDADQGKRPTLAIESPTLTGMFMETASDGSDVLMLPQRGDVSLAPRELGRAASSSGRHPDAVAPRQRSMVESFDSDVIPVSVRHEEQGLVVPDVTGARSGEQHEFAVPVPQPVAQTPATAFFPHAPPPAASFNFQQYPPAGIPYPVPQYFPHPAVAPGFSELEIERVGSGDEATPATPFIKLPPVENPATTSEALVSEVAEQPAGKVKTTDASVDAQPLTDSGSPLLELSPEALEKQKKRTEGLDLFRKVFEKAKVELTRKQEPISQKLPRLIQKHIAKLEAIDPGRTDKLVAQLNVIARTHSSFAVQALTAYADSRQFRLREVCAEGLGVIPHAISAITLLDLLRDKVASVADRAIRSLLQLGFPETLPVLIALGRIDIRSRAIISEALVELDDESRGKFVEPLRVALKTKGDAEASAFALYLLSKIKGSELLTICMGLTKHKAPEIRAAAIEALVQTGEKQSVRFLNAGMTDADPRVRVVAAAGLRKISSPKSESLLIEAMSDDHPSVRRSAVRTLVALEGTETAAAASKLLNSETDPEVIESLLEIVAKGGTDDALITLQEYLVSDERELRHRAITTLRRLKNTKGARMLAPLLSDPDHDTRRLAAEAVGQLKQKAVVPALQELLRSDTEDQVRAAAARALGDLKDDDSAHILEDALRDCRLVKCQAVIALGMLGRHDSIPALLVQLRDVAPEIRYHACNALGQIGELPDTEPLQKLLSDHDAMVRRGAEAALKKMGHKVGQANFTRHLRKFTSKLMPSVVAGAMPGGTIMIVSLVVSGIIGVLYTTMGSVGFSSEPSFPVSQILAIAVSNDGKQVSVARKFNVLEVWDAAAGQLISQFQANPGGTGIIYQPDGNALILSGKNSFVMNTAEVSSQGVESIRPASLKGISSHRVAMTPDRTKAILCSIAGQATLVDLGKNEALVNFKISDFNEEDAITVNADATLAFVGTGVGELKVFSLEDGKPLGALDIGKVIGSPKIAITALAMSLTGDSIAVGTATGNVVVVSVQDLQVLGKPYSGKGRIVGLNCIRDSARFAIVTSRGELAVCSDDFSSSQPSTTSLSSPPDRVSFSADGNVAAIAYYESDGFCVVDLSADKVLAQYPQPRE